MDHNIDASLDEMKTQMSEHLDSPGTRSQLLSCMSQLQASPNAAVPDNIFDQLPDDIKEYLFEHQKEAIDFLYDRFQRPHGFYNENSGTGAVTAERIEELQQEINDDLLIDAIKSNMNGIIGVDDHEDNFEETFDLPADFFEEF